MTTTRKGVGAEGDLLLREVCRVVGVERVLRLRFATLRTNGNNCSVSCPYVPNEKGAVLPGTAPFFGNPTTGARGGPTTGKPHSGRIRRVTVSPLAAARFSRSRP